VPQQKSKKVAINTKFPVICTPYSVFSETSRMFWLVNHFHLKNLFFLNKKNKISHNQRSISVEVLKNIFEVCTYKSFSLNILNDGKSIYVFN
jgi:hypothetical protein